MTQTTNLQFSYSPSVAFRFPDIGCKVGETLLITGASGRGKTTLLHLLGGLLKPSAGDIFIGETNITELSAAQLDRFRGQHIGIVFQQSHFIASLSVIENVMLAASLSGKPAKEQEGRQLLGQLNIGEQAGKKPQSLSQGQQQRVSIARALLNKPALLLADEPTSSLDDEACFTVAKLLQQQAQSAKVALLIVTHDQRLKALFPKNIELV